MPAKSKAQYRLMQAASQGTSNLDIPKSVGTDFIKATPKIKFKKLAEKLRPKKF